MARRILLLLIATLALGGIFALRGKRPEKRPVAAITTNIPALKLDSPSVELSPDKPQPAEFSTTTVATSRIAILALIGIALAAGAYFGLGRGSDTARAAVIEQELPAHVNLDSQLVYSAQKVAAPEDLQSVLSRPAYELTPPPAATPAPAPPTPAVAAEVETPEAVQPAAAPPPLPADGIEGIICALPWPCQQAIGVAACESGRDMNGRLDGAWASNGNHYGVFQLSYIHAYRWPDFYDAWMDPAKNAQWAYEIWSEQGWYPWSCRWAAY